jgi:hypothetical protein
MELFDKFNQHDSSFNDTKYNFHTMHATTDPLSNSVPFWEETITSSNSNF